MSLLVYACKIDQNTNTLLKIHENPREPFNDLFGFENWRQTVWNSPSLKKLNCTLLNSLSFQDIYAEEKDIQQLKDELILVKKHIIAITEELNLDLRTFKFRLENGLEAIRIAQKTENRIVYIG